jgi:hypothetical protein
MTTNKLTDALNLLDKKLGARRLELEIIICGAYAIQLIGIVRSEHTLDVDSLKKIESSEIIETIVEVGHQLGLGPRWLNDQASTVTIPLGTFDRAQSLTNWTHIKAKLIARVDLIKMKAVAFSIRRDQTNKDWEDLKNMSPTQIEMNAAIQFLIETNSPPEGSSKKIKKEFEETLSDLKNLIR